MIKYLSHIGDLTFPIVTMEKFDHLVSTPHCLEIGTFIIPKIGGVLDTFNLHVETLPETYEYIEFPELLLKTPNVLKGKLIIDNDLNIVIPIKKLKVNYTVEKLQSKIAGYIKVSNTQYYLPEIFEKNNQFPIIAKVDNVAFLIGWTNKHLELKSKLL